MKLTDVIRRYAASIVFSAMITAGLLLVMHYAVHNDEPNIEPGPIGNVVAIQPREEIPIQVKQQPPKEIPPPPETPPLTKIDFVTDPNAPGIDFGPPPEPKVEPTDTRSYGTDGDMLPVVMVSPNYPQRPKQRGIEGWVVIEFTVDRLGRVINPQVLSAKPSNVFDRAALNAVKRYKYKPRVVNGESVVVHGVRQRIVFELTQT